MCRLAVLLLTLPLAFAVCPQGTVQGTRPDNCYLYGSAQSWQEAEQYCVSNKGHLSSVPNGFVNAFLTSYPKLFESVQSYWLGAELKSAADKWTWTDDSDFIYTKWASGEPKEGSGCLYIDASTGQWHSGDCDASKPFICKVPPSCKPAPQKCEDGWTFNEKLNKCYKEKIARRYPYVVLGLKNTAFSSGGETRVYNFMWTDGSFFDYSMLRGGIEGEYETCAFFQKAKADEWTTMGCLKSEFMATAICQKKPKDA